MSYFFVRVFLSFFPFSPTKKKSSYPDPPDLRRRPRVPDDPAEPPDKPLLPRGVERPEALPGLLEVVLFDDDRALAFAGKGRRVGRRPRGVADWVKARREVVDLLVAVQKVHRPVVVVVVVGRARRVGRQQQVVGPQAVALGVGVGEDARLEELVVRVADARYDERGAEGLFFWCFWCFWKGFCADLREVERLPRVRGNK